MLGVPALLFFVPRKERKVEDPRKVHLHRVDEVQFLPEPGAQSAERGRGDFGLIGDQKNEITRFRFEALNDRLLVSRLEKLSDWRIEPRFRDAEERQPFRLQCAAE